MAEHLKKHVRMSPEKRRAALVDVGYSIAKSKGIRFVSRREVAAQADVTEGLLSHYFDGIAGLHGEIIDRAISDKNAKILAGAEVYGYELPRMSKALASEVKATVNSAGFRQ